MSFDYPTIGFVGWGQWVTLESFLYLKKKKKKKVKECDIWFLAEMVKGFKPHEFKVL